MQRTRTGFTLIELMITMVIMVILIGLSIVLIGNIQAQARDSERAQDIDSIARGLELRYNQGSSYKVGSNTVTHPKGAYPGNFEINDFYNSAAPGESLFVGATPASRTTPSGNGIVGLCMAFLYVPECSNEDVKAETEDAIQMIFRDGSKWKDLYVYEFVDSNGRYCFDDCTRYNLYWISETDQTAYKGIPGLKVIRGKHQQ